VIREGGIEKRGASPLLDAPEKERCKIFKSRFTSVKRGVKKERGSPLSKTTFLITLWSRVYGE